MRTRLKKATLLMALTWFASGPASRPLEGAELRGEEFQVNTYTTYDQLQPALAMDADGDFVVVWTSFGSSDIKGQRYASDGAMSGDEFRVNTYDGLQWFPAVAALADGEFIAVWESMFTPGTDTSSYSIHGQRFASEGSPLAGEFQINTYTTGGQRRPSVSSDADGEFVVAWESKVNYKDPIYIRGRRYASDGTPLGNDFQINTTINQGTPVVSVRPAVSRNAGGDFVVVWTSHSSTGMDSSGLSVQGQRFAADGSTLGGQFQINHYTTDAQFSGSVALGAGGDFVVVWGSVGSAGTDSSGTSIQGRRFASDGSAIGNEVQVNNFTTGNQRNAKLARSGDGAFVVLWDSVGSSGTDNSSTSIQGRLYTAAGSPHGGQFQVNTYSFSAQSYPTVGLNDDGFFVVAWQSYGSDDTDPLGYSIRGQRLSSPLFTDGFESGDTSGWSNAAPGSPPRILNPRDRTSP